MARLGRAKPWAISGLSVEQRPAQAGVYPLKVQMIEEFFGQIKQISLQVNDTPRNFVPIAHWPLYG